MSNSAFDRLAPYIQEFIWKNHWDALRDVQEKAIKAIFETNDHLLITAGTASGKTEAAFFPALSDIYWNPSESIGILYVGPLKALINDQFSRLSLLLKNADIPVYAWHGDRSQTEKKRAMADTQGVLQITPEALEGLLMHHPDDLHHMIHDLRYIIIDEVHVFMGTDRGSQLQCQLARIDRLVGKSVRRIGMSATIHDPSQAGRWLSMGSSYETAVIENTTAKRQLLLLLRHDTFLENSPENAAQNEAIQRERYQFMYEQIRGRKTILFTPSRRATEQDAAALRAIALERKDTDIIKVHHGSISSILRADAEHTLKESENAVCAVATKTLELGIDIGHLDRVLQDGNASSCSSFVQRLGRSGRRGTPATMLFFTRSELREQSGVFEQLPWELLQTIAVIQLYLEEKWIEPFEDKTLPFSLLFHQTLSTLMQYGELSAKELAKRVKSLPPFEKISHEDYIKMLRFMREEQIIEKIDNGAFLPGMVGESLTGKYTFLSVFKEEQGVKVYNGHLEIGEIESLPDVDEVITLAGTYWKVINADAQHRKAMVVATNAKKESKWHGGGADLHDHVVNKMREILDSETVYPYLQNRALQTLKEARNNAKKYISNGLYTDESNSILLHPWFGTRKMRTLELLLNKVFFEELQILGKVYPIEKWRALRVQTNMKPKEFIEALKNCIMRTKADDLLPHVDVREPLDSYDIYLPEELRRKAYVYNHLDLSGLVEAARTWR